VSAAHTLLVDVVVAVGADPADTRERVEVLRRAGLAVRAISLARAAHAPDAPAPEITIGLRREATAGRLRQAAGAGRVDRVVIAGSEADAAEFGAFFRGAAPVRHWPTAFAPLAGWRSFIAGRRTPAPLFDGHASAADWIMAACSAERAGRGRLGLWDGDYVLAPLPPGGAAAESVLRAFAAVAAERDELDLVVLAEATPAFTRRAEALGVGTRVHCAGPAPRDAEWAWWSHASAALLAGSAPFAGGLVLRALAASCPLLVPRDAGACVAAGEWLARAGCTPWGTPGTSELGATLESLLARGADVESALERGRAVAASRDAAALATRIAAASPHRVVPAASREAA
jgi:hypothetical protein